jgi:hypothetical protein
MTRWRSIGDRSRVGDLRNRAPGSAGSGPRRPGTSRIRCPATPSLSQPARSPGSHLGGKGLPGWKIDLTPTGSGEACWGRDAHCTRPSLSTIQSSPSMFNIELLRGMKPLLFAVRCCQYDEDMPTKESPASFEAGPRHRISGARMRANSSLARSGRCSGRCTA